MSKDQSQRKALGKGLSALLPRSPASNPARDEASTAASAPPSRLPESFESFESIPLDQIIPSKAQPRTTWDAERLDELAQSIREHGVIQPITVCREGAAKYSLIAGERRWRAARLAGLNTIPALVRTVEQNRLLEVALIENIQREDLNPIETAVAFSRLIEQHQLTHEQIAERTGKDRSTITNFLRLLKLPPEIQSDLSRGDISMGHARALLGLTNPAQQRRLSQTILDHGISVRTAERIVKELNQPPGLAGKGHRPEAEGKNGAIADPNVRAAMEQLQAALGTRVRLSPNKKGGGVIEIDYYSQDDLDRIYSIIVESH